MTTVPPDDARKPREDLLDDLARVFADEVRDKIDEARALGPHEKPVPPRVMREVERILDGVAKRRFLERLERERGGKTQKP